MCYHTVANSLPMSLISVKITVRLTPIATLSLFSNMFEIQVKIIELITVEHLNRTPFVPFLYGWALDSGQSLYFGNPDPSIHSIPLYPLGKESVGNSLKSFLADCRLYRRSYKEKSYEKGRAFFL
jgi:hypothetical protein